jgi:hypothetical protein
VVVADKGYENDSGLVKPDENGSKMIIEEKSKENGEADEEGEWC